MSPEKLKAAIAECKRFLARAAEVETHTYETVYGKKVEAIDPGRAAGAVRRASLDLTRALADLRKPGP